MLNSRPQEGVRLSTSSRRARVLITASMLIGAVACGTGSEEPSVESPRSLTIYSGRAERLIGPIVARFTEATGIPTQVRYGGTAEMAATLMEEGEASPADVFIGQDGGALGALAEAGLAVTLPDALLQTVESRFRAPDGRWLGLSGRPRVVVYNTERVTPDDLPQRLEDVTDPHYRGLFGLAPTNASFQAHMAVYGVANGMDALAELLAGIVANEPATYDGNSAIVRATIAGEIDWGLTNHYYLWQAMVQQPDAPAANFFMPLGDASSFVNVAGVAVVRDSTEAMALVEYLLGREGQEYFASETFEYPLAAGINPSPGLQPMAELRTPDINFQQVGAALADALRLIRESGLVP